MFTLYVICDIIFMIEVDEMENKVFAERIKKLRIEKKLTQQELGNKFGLTSTGVSYWESGKAIPSMDMINKLSDFFGVTIDYLIGKRKIDENDEGMILFRKAEQVNENDKKKMYNIINSTIDAFLNNNNNND